MFQFWKFLWVFIFVFGDASHCVKNERKENIMAGLIGGYCEQHPDCPGAGIRARCQSNICVCQPQYIQRNDMTDCLNIRQQTGDSCEEPQQCTKGGLGHLADCSDAGRGNQCQCQSSAVQLQPNTACLLKAVKVNEPCQIELQCLANLGESYCLGTQCKCLPTAVPSRDGTKCLRKRYIGDFCTETAECNHYTPERPIDCHSKNPLNPSEGFVCACDPGFISPPGSTDQCYKLATQLGESCEHEDNRCSLLADSECNPSTKICECDGTTKVPSLDKTRCLPQAPSLGDICEENQQCNIANSECDVTNVCSCIENDYVESQQIPGECVQVIQEVGSTCTENIQCQTGDPGPWSECYDNVGSKTCECMSDAHLLPTNPRCYKKVNLVNDECEVTAQCQIRLGGLSECIRDHCACVTGSIPSSDGSKCLAESVLIDDDCIDHAQCVSYPEAFCNTNLKCECQSDFVASKARDTCLSIQNLIGGDCVEDQQCKAGHPGPLSNCIDGGTGLTCECTKAGVTLPGNNVCEKKAEYVGDACSHDIQCSSGLGLSNCVNSKCECAVDASATPDGKQCVRKKYLGEDCLIQAECTHIQLEASCHYSNPAQPQLGGKCGCNVGFESPPSVKDKCYKIMKLIGESCIDHDIQCSRIPSALCRQPDKSCQCDYNTHVASENKDKCLPKINLNNPCEEDDQCHVANSECTLDQNRKLCLCMSNQYIESVQSPGNCVQIVRQINQPCSESLQCTSGLGMSSACINGVCHCRSPYEFHQNHCYYPTGLDGRCDHDPECILGVNEFAFCNRLDGRCSCLSTAVPYAGLCYNKATSIGQFCEYDFQCSSNIDGSKCFNNRCGCTPPSVPGPGGTSCIKGQVLIGGECNQNDQCVGHPTTSECTGICSCLTDYVASASKTVCLPIQNRLNEVCVETPQCTTGTPGPLSTCIRSQSLFTCQCLPEAINPIGQHECKKKATIVGDLCQHHIQCTANLDQSQCQNGKCDCLPHAVPNELATKCIQKRYLGDTCTSNEECNHLLYSASCRVVDAARPQLGSTCQCNPGYAAPVGVKDNCFKLATFVGDLCSNSDIQCSTVTGSKCVEFNKTCDCDYSTQIASTDRKKCLPKNVNLNDLCEDSKQCLAEHSECGGSVGSYKCLCKEQYIASTLKPNTCLQVLQNVDLPCTEHQQCVAGIGQNSECHGVCKCIPNYGFYLKNCYRSVKLGASCTNNGECIIGTNKLAGCTSGRCECVPSSIPYENSCYEEKLLNDSCQNDFECSVSITGVVHCNAGKCDCIPGFNAVDDMTCDGSKLGATVSFMGFLLCLTILW